VADVTRREALAGASAGALGAAGLGALVPGAEAAATEPPTVRGSWKIMPKVPAGQPQFIALAVFGADGIFVTTGSDEPGTGIGAWKAKGRHGFAFAYTFHFNASGALSSTVKVEATGTFGRARLHGDAMLRRLDRNGNLIGSPLHTTFTGRRLAA
jgi:hypothetical protein